MAPETVSALALRVGEHVRRHELRTISVVLHGGEPLLAGVPALERLVSAVSEAVPDSTRVRFGIQTNGVLLDDRFLDFFHRYGIRVGVSVDGGAAAHDRHRRTRDGRPSYAAVEAALTALARPDHHDIYAGLLCTVDLANEPLEVYRSLLAFSPPEIDLLLPHGNWAYPPPGRRTGDPATPYADWLIAVFDQWFHAAERATGIRLFESIIARVLGGRSWSEAIGGEPADAVTIETDGSIERTDVLKTTASGMAATGLNVFANTLDEVLAHPSVRAERAGRVGLGDACRSCPVVAICGGGLYAHRYRSTNGFANPSVYCPDLLRLISHINSRVADDPREP
jgi:uncharacterized protein